MEIRRIILSSIAVLCALSLSAQEGPKSEAEQEKEIYEAIQTQVENYEQTLNLEYWQVFYVDSILTNNTRAVAEAFKAMNASRVSNPDLYMDVKDKWAEKTYEAFRKVLNDEQWAKYLKTGAARDKKTRDKRVAKKN